MDEETAVGEEKGRKCRKKRLGTEKEGRKEQTKQEFLV